MIELFKEDDRKQLLKVLEVAMGYSRRNAQAQKKYLEYLILNRKNRKQQSVEEVKQEQNRAIIQALEQAHRWIKESSNEKTNN
jgi:hypothetical protein